MRRLPDSLASRNPCPALPRLRTGYLPSLWPIQPALPGLPCGPGCQRQGEAGRACQPPLGPWPDHVQADCRPANHNESANARVQAWRCQVTVQELRDILASPALSKDEPVKLGIWLDGDTRPNWLAVRSLARLSLKQEPYNESKFYLLLEGDKL